MPTKRGPARKSTAIKRKHRFRKKHTHHVTPVQMKELLDEAKALLETWLINYDAVEVQVLADLESKLVGVIQDIEDKLDHASHGLAALKTLIDGLEATLEEIKGAGFIGAIHSLKALWDLVDLQVLFNVVKCLVTIGTVVDRLDDPVYGLDALKDLIDDLEDKLDDPSFGLANLKALIDAVEAKLDVPDNFKADVSALALEATLTAIKGAGWSAETLHAIYDLIDAILDLTRTADTLTANGAEQNVYINDAPASTFKPLHVLIDTTNMALNDDITIKTYYRLKNGGGYILATDEDYSDVQAIPLKIHDLYPNLYGVKVTLEQTGGVNRDYDWEVYYGS